ncbi:hypothetical protein [Cytobacillus sp. FSL R7-0680]|uniref:hypothetical protein n=1 Tax=Cytobacillus sp. FSL R7-0680 TaxID=2921689 RepID=UPI0030FB3A82
MVKLLRFLKKWRSKQIHCYLKLELAAPFQSDDKQHIFTVYNQLKHEMDYCRLAYLNEKLERIYLKNPELQQINVHAFRHTHASLLFAAGASIKDVYMFGGENVVKYNLFVQLRPFP